MAVAIVAAMALPGANARAAGTVSHYDTTVNGFAVDKYAWPDSQGRGRSVSLKKEGAGNPGHGGYAIRLTYQAYYSGEWHNVVVNAPAGDGFGYFVSHEVDRNFSDGSYGTIAQQIFGKDDSPLGRGFAVTSQRLATNDPSRAAQRFSLTYRHYGTLDAIPKNGDGEDSQPTPIDPAALKLYSLPVTITWYFQAGTDYPRIRTSVGLGQVDGPDRVNFDVRGPYGVLDFDGGRGLPIARAMWGDRYRFVSQGNPLTRNSSWTWNVTNTGARYGALIAGAWEMGLFEPLPWTKSALAHGFAFGRGSTSADYQCADEGNVQVLPCDWEWPYQSAQYSLPYEDLDGSTTYKKMAWGSAPYYGAGPSLSRVWDSSTTSRPFNGWPASGLITYDVCVVLGRTISGGLTRSAAAGPAYNCAAP